MDIILLEGSNPRADYCGERFEIWWLSRYPKPNKCLYDNGNEFLGQGFQDILDKHKVEQRATTVKNSQSNGMCERMHQTMLNVLKVYAKTTRIDGYNQARHLMEHAIATCVHATRIAINHTMQHTSGEIFQREMLLDIPVIADLVAIRQRRQLLIDENLRSKMKRGLSIITRLENMSGSRYMILRRVMISSMALIKFRRLEQMELLLFLEMKKAMC